MSTNIWISFIFIDMKANAKGQLSKTVSTKVRLFSYPSV